MGKKKIHRVHDVIKLEEHAIVIPISMIFFTISVVYNTKKW